MVPPGHAVVPPPSRNPAVRREARGNPIASFSPPPEGREEKACLATLPPGTRKRGSSVFPDGLEESRMKRITYGLVGGLLLAAAVPSSVFAAEEIPIDSGDTAWLLMSTALVMVMLPGLALFYGGLVRRKNVLSTIMHSFFGLALVSIVWVLVGFSLAFAPDVEPASGLIGGLDFVGFMNVGLEPDHGYAADHPVRPVRGVPADVRGHHAGAHHRRLRRAQALRRVRRCSRSSGRSSSTRPIAHWVWSTDGWLFKLGALDFAGGTVVHISSGVSALIVALLIGRRVVNGERHGAARRAR